MLLKLTLENLSEIKILPEEKRGLENLLKLAEKLWYEIYLFWSRTKWWWSDIDLIVKWNRKPSLKDILKLSVAFHKYSDTKLDLIPYCEKTKNFIEYLAE